MDKVNTNTKYIVTVEAVSVFKDEQGYEREDTTELYSQRFAKLSVSSLVDSLNSSLNHEAATNSEE